MQKKEKIFYQCSSCSYVSLKWLGQCPSCGQWNSLEEKIKNNSLQEKKFIGKAQTTLNPLKFLKKDFSIKRFKSGINEFDRTIGGGFLNDSFTLLVGSPGIGKSTITLQIATKIAKENKKILICSGEESAEQIAQRVFRINKNIQNLSLLHQYSIENALATAEKEKIDFLIIDSVQTFLSEELPSSAGSLVQIKKVAEKIMNFAKKKSIPCLLIGHVTKDGEMAGPQFLAHLTDTVLLIEGEKNSHFRIIRSLKNRFGSTNEVGIFEMTEKGLIEVKNPSSAFLSGRLDDAKGSVVFPTLEGNRSFLVELQGLSSITHFGFPKRTVSGIALARLNLLLAVLQNHAKVNFENRDVFANVVGGFKISENAADLALCLALISCYLKKPFAKDAVAFGEIGLAGEIRNVSFLEKRLQEAKKMGFKKALVPKLNKLPILKNLEIIPVKTILEAKECLSRFY